MGTKIGQINEKSVAADSHEEFQILKNHQEKRVGNKAKNIIMLTALFPEDEKPWGE